MQQIKATKWDIVDNQRKKQKHLIVFDIDRTILQRNPRHVRVRVVGVPNEGSDLVANDGMWHFIFRPGLFQLLIMAHQFCNIILFTAGSINHAKTVTNLINARVAALSYIKTLYLFIFCYVLFCFDLFNLVSHITANQNQT